MLTITLQLFLFFVMLFVFFQASKHLSDSSTHAFKKVIYICGIFQIEVATQVSWLFEQSSKARKGQDILDFGEWLETRW